jgi:DNA-binding transcriptional MerR regulator
MESGIGVAAVARRLGVAPATLRTWDRRYGLGPSDHIEGSHRRYTGADLGRLEHMQRLVRAGVAPRDAATAALNSPSTAAEVAVGPFVQSDHTPSATAAVRGLRRAAAALDVDTTSRLIGDQIERRGVVWTWDHVIAPVLVVIGQGWAATGKGLEAEHALSEVVSAAFARVCFENSVRLRDRYVLLAAGPEDLHTLPLEATAAALAERGVGSRFRPEGVAGVVDHAHASQLPRRARRHQTEPVASHRRPRLGNGDASRVGAILGSKFGCHPIGGVGGHLIVTTFAVD